MNKNNKVAVEIGAGLVAAGAAAAAGYYYFGSDTAKQHRKSAALWAQRMKREVVAEVKKLRKVSPDVYARIIDRVSLAYRDIRGVGKSEVSRAAKELKKNWKLVKKEAQARTKAAVRAKSRTRSK